MNKRQLNKRIKKIAKYHAAKRKFQQTAERELIKLLEDAAVRICIKETKCL